MGVDEESFIAIDRVLMEKTHREATKLMVHQSVDNFAAKSASAFPLKEGAAA